MVNISFRSLLVLTGFRIFGDFRGSLFVTLLHVIDLENYFASRRASTFRLKIATTEPTSNILFYLCK